MDQQTPAVVVFVVLLLRPSVLLGASGHVAQALEQVHFLPLVFSAAELPASVLIVSAHDGALISKPKKMN